MKKLKHSKTVSDISRMVLCSIATLFITMPVAASAASSAGSAQSNACSQAKPTKIDFEPPKKVQISPASAANFQRRNHNGYGSIFVILHRDGAVSAYLPASSDLDHDLRTSLRSYAAGIRISPVTACHGPLLALILRYSVPSGDPSWQKVRMTKKLADTLNATPQYP